MSVTEQPVEPMSEAFSTEATALGPQAALELAHELVLVTRATFAQLLPETATRAVSGVPGLGGATVMAASPSPAPAAQVAPTTAISVAATPVPVPASSVSTPAVAGPVSVSAIAVPVVASPGDPTPELETVVVGDEQPQDLDDDGSPTAPISIPTPAVTIQNPAAYIPVPGVETPAAASVVPLVQPAPIAAPISLSVAEPTRQAAPEPEMTESEADAPVEPVAPLRPFHPNLAMLEEIGFLDE